MINSNYARAAMFAALFSPQLALASDWAIMQTSNVTSDATLTQTDVSNSQQAINGIALDENNDSLIGSTQTANLSGSNLTLEQTGTSTNANVQAINLVSAQSLDSVTQQVTGFDEIQISNSSSTGSDNVQALNYTTATMDINNLAQIVTGDTVVARNDVQGNVQTLNYVSADSYRGSLEQSVTLNTLNVSTLGGGEVRVNSVQGNIEGLASPLIQNVNIINMVVSPGSTYVLNHVSP